MALCGIDNPCFPKQVQAFPVDAEDEEPVEINYDSAELTMLYQAIEDKAFMAAKVTTARFYADHLLSRAPGVRDSIVEGAQSVNELALDAF